MMALIEIKDIVKTYEGSPAVDGIGFSIEEGEIFAMLGPSGCGKTTTLRLIAGFERPDGGEILLGGNMVAGVNTFVPPEKRKVGMVFQDYALFPHISVRENIAFGLRDLEGEEKDSVVDNMLEFVGLSGYGGRHPHKLSGGQQQRVALARALAPCPLMVVLDEPFSNLDTDMRTQMREDMLKILRTSNATTILVTHDQEEAFSMADRIAVMNNGNIEQIGTPEEIYHHPATSFVAEFVGKADFIEGVIEDEGILTEIGLFTNKTSLKKGERVELMIRPDDIEIVPDINGSCIIKEKRFKGYEVLYTICLKNGTIVHSTAPSSIIQETGSMVDIRVKVDHVVVFQNGKAVF
ncbi:ABC transporter ATP-binding protein [Methanolobus sp. WCC4]|uniref:ABC transporter ATP-binding protein n=1 Tax=Methanolobus sp. WCC4 TaxID=3125784 RepID=UPI0030FD16AF